MFKRAFLIQISALILFAAPGGAQDTKFPPQGEQIPGPEYAGVDTGQCCFTPDQVRPPSSGFAAWLTDIQHWRREKLIRMGYDGSQYARPELKWTQSSFIQPQ